jgi:cold shock CspA family protein
MRVHGTLKKWNDERGFGFVALPQTHEEVFVHISAFPRDGVRPRVGETISFEVLTGPDGRKRAEAVQRPGARRAPAGRSARSNRKRGLLSSMPLVAVVAIGVVGYNFYASHRGVRATPSQSPAVEAAHESFTCDGRTHCSQMTSCEEATYFLRHCPGVRMDGDGDGEPCEDQWCN